MDTTLDQITNQELAETLREGGGCTHEALARLLEADAKNHELIANSESKWRDMLCEVVLAYNAMMTQARHPEWNHATYTPDFHYAMVRYEGVIQKAEALIKEGERHFTEPYPEGDFILASDGTVIRFETEIRECQACLAGTCENQQEGSKAIEEAFASQADAIAADFHANVADNFRKAF